MVQTDVASCFRKGTCPFLAGISKESGMSVPATKLFWRALPIIVAIAFAYATVLAKLSHDWWTDENYSHGLLIPFIIGYLLWVGRDKFASARTNASVWLGGATVAVALMALWAGVAGAELYTQRMSLVLLLAGVIVYFWGLQLLRLVLIPFFLLILAIPIPAIIFNRIAFPLQLFASRCAVWSMQMLGIPVLRQGNVIELKPLNSFETKKLEVVEACSGIRSLMTLITLGVVFAYFTFPKSEPDHPKTRFYGMLRSAIIVLSAIPIAIVTNALRVSGTGVLAHYYGTQIADGFFHSFSGWVVYIVAFLMLFGVGWLLDRFRPKSSSVEKKLDSTDSNSRVNSPQKVISVEGTE
jgi:exosortase